MARLRDDFDGPRRVRPKRSVVFERVRLDLDAELLRPLGLTIVRLTAMRDGG